MLKYRTSINWKGNLIRPDIDQGEIKNIFSANDFPIERQN